MECNLETFFNCRFIATEFSTGNLHSGRIDTLAISEDNNPVIIEYKKVASSELIRAYITIKNIEDFSDTGYLINEALKNIGG